MQTGHSMIFLSSSDAEADTFRGEFVTLVLDIVATISTLLIAPNPDIIFGIEG